MKINFIPAISYYNTNFTGPRNRKSPVDAQGGSSDVFVKNQSPVEHSGMRTKEIVDRSHGPGGTPAALFNEIEWPCNKFKSLLELLLEDLMVDESNPDRPIGSLIVERKSRNSIREKILSKQIKSKKEAIAEIDDLVRARIILNTGTSDEGDAVVTKLIEAVKAGKLKVAEIINYRPNDFQERRKYEYVKTLKVNELATAAQDSWQTPILRAEEKETGYLAMHIIFLLKSGHKAELQIMGADVAKLKEVEDVCYKIKCNKNVDPAFSRLVKAMKKLKSNPRLMAKYNLYTKEAYRHERLKHLGKKSKGDDTGFLKLADSDVARDSGIPEILDFNEVAKRVAIAERAKVKDKDKE